MLYERLVLEINQADLSWLTILKKREEFVAAYDGFEVDKVAAYGETKRARLLTDVSIYSQSPQSRRRYRQGETNLGFTGEPWIL